MYQSLLTFLQEVPRPGDYLTLAGDIFDLYVGNKPVFYEEYRLFEQLLREKAGAGVVITYIQGNHDFLVNERFSGIKNLTVCDSEIEIKAAGKKFYIAHGDLVDQRDWKYLLMRKLFRGNLVRLLVKILPGSWIRAVGQTLSKESRSDRPTLPQDLEIESRDMLRSVYRSFAKTKFKLGFDYVVLGHCHDLDEIEAEIGKRKCQYANVGFPPIHGTCLEWKSESEGLRRITLPGF